ncbi:MAG: thioesterase [Ruminococcus sp.]|uniref:thioesterase II family protein n=1 Tax=Ruminococcus sp. TaxID=41978 RepID=UPI0025F9B0DA|nr:thioesterase domain-containing protein [Ruminococcus sp.]MCR5600950.1 thioesterase [Ruminococcus sp.]
MSNYSTNRDWEKWFPFSTYPLDDSTHLKVICFHHAGGSASVYRSWTQIKGEFNFIAVEFAGKGTRKSERFITDFAEIAPSLCEAVDKLVGSEEYIIFGHSMGAAAAFYTADFMSRLYGHKPTEIIVACRHAPHVELEGEFKSYMDDEALIDELRRYNATPKEILENREILDFLLPSIRKDYELNDSFRYHEEMLDVPVIAHCATDDEDATKELMEAWSEVTSEDFYIKEFEGGHFFIFDMGMDYVGELMEEIDQYCYVGGRNDKVD